MNNGRNWMSRSVVTVLTLMLASNLLLVSNVTGFEAVTLTPDVKDNFWESVETVKEKGWATLSLNRPEKTIELPTPIPNITSATFGTWQWPKTEHAIIEYNADATKATLVLPDSVVGKDDVPVTLRFANMSKQFPNGRIVLSALDAEVVGDTAKLETHPGNHRIGFWSNAADFVQWKYKATRPAKYQVQLCLLYTSPSPRDATLSRMPSSA